MSQFLLPCTKACIIAVSTVRTRQKKYLTDWRHSITLLSGGMAFCLLGLLGGTSAYAAVTTESPLHGGLSLNRTRVIFSSTAKSVPVTLNNTGSRVYLVKGRITQGDGRTDSPSFMVTPPLFRLEPHSEHTVLILRQGQGTLALPTDRESLFYLQLLAIPATKSGRQASDADVSAQINIGLQQVIKVFYRPAGLMPQPTAAEKQLTFHQTPAGLQVNNPTPYYLTLASVTVDQRAVNVKSTGAMLAPYSQQTYPNTVPGKQVQWTVINDYGGISVPYSATITPLPGASS